MLGLSESSRNAAMISASIVVAAAILGAAQAATDNVFRYSSPKTGYFGIDNMAMSPDDGTESLDYRNGWDEGLALQEPHNNFACFNTGIHLPHGAVITEARVFYQRGASANGPLVSIQRKRYATGANNTIAEEALPQTQGRAGINIALNSSFVTVDNTAFSYGFGFCLKDEDDVFYAARIKYTYQNAGD